MIAIFMALIFDIGMNNGDDTAYYLSLGHEVIGVEANPLLVESCQKRFSDEIKRKRLTILNVGVLDSPGEFTFYRNLSDHGCSSFDPVHGKLGGKWEELSISCVTAAFLIAQFGVPYFLKVDVEGMGEQVISTMQSGRAPKYISMEIESPESITHLGSLGYTGFKLVSGQSFRPGEPIWDHEHGWRMLRKIGRTVPPIRRALGKLTKQKAEFEPQDKYDPTGYGHFTQYSSGPFGEDAFGDWLPERDAMNRFASIRAGYERAGKPRHFLWWDVHAKHP